MKKENFPGLRSRSTSKAKSGTRNHTASSWCPRLAGPFNCRIRVYQAAQRNRLASSSFGFADALMFRAWGGGGSPWVSGFRSLARDNLGFVLTLGLRVVILARYTSGYGPYKAKSHEQQQTDSQKRGLAGTIMHFAFHRRGPSFGGFYTPPVSQMKE